MAISQPFSIFCSPTKIAISIIRLTTLHIHTNPIFWSSLKFWRCTSAPVLPAAVPLLRIPPVRYIASNMWRSHPSKLWHSPWVCYHSVALNIWHRALSGNNPPFQILWKTLQCRFMTFNTFSVLEAPKNTNFVDGPAKWGCDQWLIIHDARLVHVGLKVASSTNPLIDAHSKKTKTESTARLMVAKTKAKWLVCELNYKSEHIETRRHSERKGSKYHA